MLWLVAITAGHCLFKLLRFLLGRAAGKLWTGAGPDKLGARLLSKTGLWHTAYATVRGMHCCKAAVALPHSRPSPVACVVPYQSLNYLTTLQTTAMLCPSARAVSLAGQQHHHAVDAMSPTHSSRLQSPQYSRSQARSTSEQEQGQQAFSPSERGQVQAGSPPEQVQAQVRLPSEQGQGQQGQGQQAQAVIAALSPRPTPERLSSAALGVSLTFQDELDLSAAQATAAFNAVQMQRNSDHAFYKKSSAGEHNSTRSSKQGTVKALASLSPFVPQLLKQDMVSNHDRYRAFDGIDARDLAKAAQSLEPCMSEIQMSIMIADVKGFTQLTEVLTKSTRGAGQGRRG